MNLKFWKSQDNVIKKAPFAYIAKGDFFMKKDFVVAGVYIAAVIGAGFASGSEVVHYFVKYGKISIIGIIISALLFGIMAGIILSDAKKLSLNNFMDYIEAVFGRKTSYIIKAASLFFMSSVFVAMISGGGETLFELINVKKYIGVGIILLFTALVLFFDVRGLMAANGVMSAVMVTGIILVCVYIFFDREIEVFSYAGDWVVSGVVYTGYNILTAGAVLPAMGSYCKKPLRVGIISGVFIFLLLSALWGIINIYYGKIPLGSIPMLTICKRHGGIISAFYSVILFMAMLTTALANGFAILDTVKGNRLIKVGFLSAFGFLFSGISFDFFVKDIYRLAGVIGIFFMAVIFYKKFIKKQIY